MCVTSRMQHTCMASHKQHDMTSCHTRPRVVTHKAMHPSTAGRQCCCCLWCAASSQRLLVGSNNAAAAVAYWLRFVLLFLVLPAGMCPQQGACRKAIPCTPVRLMTLCPAQPEPYTLNSLNPTPCTQTQHTETSTLSPHYPLIEQ
jgi:hypothetical protein